MAILEILGPRFGTNERARLRIFGFFFVRRRRRSGVTFHARDRAVENEEPAIIHYRKALCTREHVSLNIDAESSTCEILPL